MSQSLENFIFDQKVRQFDCKNTIYSLPISKEFKKEVLAEVIPTEYNLLSKTYHLIRESILKNVIMTFENDEAIIEQATYHSRYGWVVSLQEKYAYLGKINILQAHVRIGVHSYFSGQSDIRGSGTLQIGKFTSIANNLTVLTSNNSHPTNFPTTYNLGGNKRIIDEGKNISDTFYNFSDFSSDVSIGNDVWIGEDVKLMNGVSLGDGCVIGTKALVTKDCKPYGVYGGVPAKLIKYRFPYEIIEQLLEIKWWNWPEIKIKQNETFFLTDLHRNNSMLKELIED